MTLWIILAIAVWLLSGISVWVLAVYRSRSLTTNDLLILIPCALMGLITVLIYIITVIDLKDHTLWKW